MRYLCCASYLQLGAIHQSQLFRHIDKCWSITEVPAKSANNPSTLKNDQITRSSVFIIDCESVDQLTSNLATMPGSGFMKLQLFPIPELNE